MRYIGVGWFMIMDIYWRNNSILQSSRQRRLNTYILLSDRERTWSNKRRKMPCYNLRRRWNFSINVRDWDVWFAFFNGVPARRTEPHRYRMWSTFFRLVVTWLTKRTYMPTVLGGGGGETTKRKGGKSQACSLRLSPYILDTEHTYYGQLTAVKTGHPLTSITWPNRDLRRTTPRGHVFFWSYTLTSL